MEATIEESRNISLEEVEPGSGDIWDLNMRLQQSSGNGAQLAEYEAELAKCSSIALLSDLHVSGSFGTDEF